MFKNNLIFIIILIVIILFPSATYSNNLSNFLLQNDFVYNNNPNSVASKDNFSKSQTSQKITLTSSQIKQIIGLQWLLNQGFNGSNVRIGIVDTGIKANTLTSHGASVFGNRVIDEKSFVNTANNYSGNDSSTNDTIGHGTEVASIAAGSEYGMAPAATLVAGKIFSFNITGNAGYYGEETTRGVVEAILYCVQQNATIINLSIGQYSNIVNDGRQYFIDKLSKEKNIIFTISAANEGSDGIDGGSIGTPGTAFQAITVAASNGANIMAPFSSSGIRSDYTVKPDITAPGENIPVNTISNSNKYTDGTSFSAPIVAGGIAVLIDALARSGRTYTVGAIKAALLETANPIGSYPIWYQGAGMVNFTAAYQLLMNRPLINSVPSIVTAFPKKLPIAPLNTLFNEQVVPFNLTVISSNYNSAQISLHNIPADTMSFNNQQFFNNSERLSILFHPTKDTPVRTYNGYLQLIFNNGEILNITIQFTVKKPIIKVLFDETRNGFVNIKRPGDPASKLDDPWGDTTFLLGQYRYFYNLMAINDISVTPFYTGTYTNLTYLNQFNTIVFPYPNSKVTNIFTDWYNDPLYNGKFNLTEPTLLFSHTELNTINSYIQDNSKGILILTSDQIDTNATAFNGLLKSLGLGYTLSNPPTTIAESFAINSTNELFSNITRLDYYGTSFTSLNTTPNVESLENGKFLISDGYSKNKQIKGRIIASGSAYFAENYMLNPSNTNYANDCKFVMNMISWLNGYNPNLNYFLPNTYTGSEVSAQAKFSNNGLTFSCNQQIYPDTSESVTVNSQTANATYDFVLSFLMIPLITLVVILEYKRRKL